MRLSLGNATDAINPLRLKTGKGRAPAATGSAEVRNAHAISQRGGENLALVVEVHPPLRARQECRAQWAPIQPEFFPLVSAAHEFKTPLVSVLGYTSLMRNGQLGRVTKKQWQVLGEIQESSERLQKLIEDLLLLCQLKTAKDRSRNRAECAEANLQVREIFNYWTPLAVQKSITYVFLPARGDPWVRVEALQLQHIVSSLIENAIKFTPAGGRVNVSMSSCFWDRRRTETGFLFKMQRRGDHKVENAVRIDVCDSGPGIHPDHYEEIFGDFVQLPGASSHGTGLGLAIARRLTEAHGGAIWVESEPGRGSKFSLLLNQTRYSEEIRGNARQHTACG
ncbi:MAG TPA: HAMP domain-containing sensor histidine kinase [Candidatus Angelobacter sp.]|nr:HAMP domain-containing sensor histidine kinase [Candidatus Angelobacter sp.]